MENRLRDHPIHYGLIFNTLLPQKIFAGIASTTFNRFSSGCERKLEKDPLFYLQPIAYSQYGSDLGLKGLVSYSLQEIRLDDSNLQTTMFLPKGYSVVDVCGGDLVQLMSLFKMVAVDGFL